MPAPRGDKWEQDMEARLARLEQRASRPFSNTGFSSPGPGVVQVDGNLVVEGFMQGSGFDGDLDTNNVGTTGWAMSASKVALPEVLLRPGSIGNDLLTQPVEVGVARDGRTNFAIGASSAAKASASIVVPAGYTRALIQMSTNASVCNSTAAVDYLYLDSWIGPAASGGTVFVGAGAGQYVSVSGACVADVTGLSGGDTVLCQARLSSGSPWGATSTNIAAVNALAVFLRG